MGLTVGTFRQLIEEAATRWAKFRRALRREDQEFFDRVFLRARCYTQAATYQCHDNPMEAILLAVAVDQEKRLHALEERAGVVCLPEDPACPSAASRLRINGSEEGASRQLFVLEQLTELKLRPPEDHAHRRMDLRSLPEPAGDDAVADGSEPAASPSD